LAFTLDTKLSELLDHPQAKAILDKHMPGVSTNPMIAMARGMSLSSILSMPQAAQFGVTKEKVENILAEVNTIG
jgi:beta-glucosidase